MDLHDIRRSYSLDKLTEESINSCPFKQFEQWLKEVVEAQVPDPTAMVLSTVDTDNTPNTRIVLLKEQVPDGFVFFTNYSSAKAKDISQNPNVSLHFPWHFMERQVSIKGIAEKLSKVESMRYFLSRPKESQLAAFASRQSQRVSSRQALMQQFDVIKEKYKNGEIPMPDFWGGYKVIPTRIEFWQGGEHRLHDRFVFKKTHDAYWSRDRLQP